MPLRLTVGAARKVADDDHGSRGASINLEVELDSSLVADAARLQEQIRHLFGLIHQSLADELSGQGQPARDPPRQSMPPKQSSPASRPTNGKPHARLATPAQVKALYAITKQQGVDLYESLQGQYGVDRPEELTLKQASAFIDLLKSENTAPAS